MLSKPQVNFAHAVQVSARAYNAAVSARFSIWSFGRRGPPDLRPAIEAAPFRWHGSADQPRLRVEVLSR